MLRQFLIAGLSGAALCLTGAATFAADVTLKLHQMLPPQATASLLLFLGVFWNVERKINRSRARAIIILRYVRHFDFSKIKR